MELPVLLLDNAIKRGTILHSDIFEIDHAKFFVVIAVTKDSVVGFFYINSKVNGNVIRKEEQYKLQYQILPIDYSFLDHVSYIDATTVTEISKETLAKSIKDNRTTIKGELCVKDLEGLLAKLRSSKLFSKHDKERYFFWVFIGQKTWDKWQKGFDNITLDISPLSLVIKEKTLNIKPNKK